MNKDQILSICEKLSDAIEKEDEERVKVYGSAILGGILSDVNNFDEILEGFSSGRNVIGWGMGIYTSASMYTLMSEANLV